jgi:hypothetical protein
MEYPGATSGYDSIISPSQDEWVKSDLVFDYISTALAIATHHLKVEDAG